MRSILYGLLVTLLLPSVVFSREGGFVSDRQEIEYEYRGLIPESRVVINMPEPEYINPAKPTIVIFYALPNGNTIEQTKGRKPDAVSGEKDGWRYDIQHIAAQTRFLRSKDKNSNYVVVYLESALRAWTTHASKYGDSPRMYRNLIDTVRSIIADKSSGKAERGKQSIVLSSHSGGGRFIFSYIQGEATIPDYIKRIVFLDSVYGYEESLHSDKFCKWLGQSSKNALVVYSYIDTTVILDGKHIVSPTGGTGYKSRQMAGDLIAWGMKLTSASDTSFCSYTLKNKVQILIKENPHGKIYHTVLVERNGFVSSVLFGTRYEQRGYKFWGNRCYNPFID
ncbi:hypothetical protein BRDCF_p300 [Bacteroidales bacterium CF]|jgi:hypothetical protein|nr:hypothetical protein BRDCF_p300 [Bacteroidales bacterium CF]